MIHSFASLATNDLLNKFKKPSKKSPNSESNLKPGILAFRTITTMLALIQCPTETTKIEPIHVSKRDRKELRILDTLAALLVREYEKVAVMAKSLEGSVGKSLQVISVVNLNNPRSAVPVPERDSGSWPIRWFASLNARRTSQKTRRIQCGLWILI